MRGALHAMRKADAAEAASRAVVVEKMGELAGPVVFESVKIMARQQTIKGLGVPAQTKASPLDIVRAQARTIRLAEDLRLEIYRPHDWASAALNVFKERPCPLSAAEIILVGRGAVSTGRLEVAYAATAAGLARNESPSTTARLLLVRAGTFERWTAPKRKTQCLRAALELARQANDEGLIKQVLETIDREGNSRYSFIFADKGPGRPIGPEVLRQVLEQEMAADKYIQDGWGADRFVVPEAVENEGRGFGGFGPDFGFDDDEDHDDDDDDDGEYDDATPFGRGYDDDGDDQPGSPGPTLLDALPLPDDISAEDLEQINEITRQMGDNPPQELLNNPEKMIEAMSNVMGKKLNAVERALLVARLKEFIRSGSPGGVPGKKNRKG
jgi:hypothetical protein